VSPRSRPLTSRSPRCAAYRQLLRSTSPLLPVPIKPLAWPLRGQEHRPGELQNNTPWAYASNRLHRGMPCAVHQRLSCCSSPDQELVGQVSVKTESAWEIPGLHRRDVFLDVLRVSVVVGAHVIVKTWAELSSWSPLPSRVRQGAHPRPPSQRTHAWSSQAVPFPSFNPPQLQDFFIPLSSVGNAAEKVVRVRESNGTGREFPSPSFLSRLFDPISWLAGFAIRESRRPDPRVAAAYVEGTSSNSVNSLWVGLMPRLLRTSSALFEGKLRDLIRDSGGSGPGHYPFARPARTSHARRSPATSAMPWVASSVGLTCCGFGRLACWTAGPRR
jgi:hypothetical protein